MINVRHNRKRRTLLQRQLTGGGGIAGNPMLAHAPGGLDAAASTRRLWVASTQAFVCFPEKNWYKRGMNTINIPPSNETPRPFPTGKDGLTLVEMLTALLIFAMAIGGLCSLSVSAKQILDTSRDHYIAVNLAKNRIERVKTFNFDELGLFSEVGTLLDGAGAPDMAGSFSRATVVSNVNDSLKEVIVTISIKHRKTLKFAPAQQQVRTYIADIANTE